MIQQAIIICKGRSLGHGKQHKRLSKQEFKRTQGSSKGAMSLGVANENEMVTKLYDLTVLVQCSFSARSVLAQ
ncbi:hypothetical protein I6I99_26100 [Sphingobacterium multivorum]|nr:hypothetical protein [Sphingobacterium multivorum]QQT30715.1 hypothetical protein I6I99_26100 [Sphingobacterium multivorum]